MVYRQVIVPYLYKENTRYIILVHKELFDRILKVQSLLGELRGEYHGNEDHPVVWFKFWNLENIRYNLDCNMQFSLV